MNSVDLLRKIFKTNNNQTNPGSASFLSVATQLKSSLEVAIDSSHPQIPPNKFTGSSSKVQVAAVQNV